MRATILTAFAFAALTAPTMADTYPVSGKWGESASAAKGPIDCAGLRTVSFNGAVRIDSHGGVPAYRNRTVLPIGPSRWRVVDQFTTTRISNAHTTYTLRQIDADHVEMVLQSGGTVKLRRCK
jgi:hypothetical protein